MSGLWTPPSGVALLKMRKRERLVVLEGGERVKVTVDDWGNTQIEHDETLDAIVKPRPIKIKRDPRLLDRDLAALRARGVKVNVRR